jgi:hypothetical protein
MKPLYEFLGDVENKVLVETFGSDVMNILNKTGMLAKNTVWKLKLANMFAWDKMTNDDFKIYEDGNVEELIKKIYKKSGSRNFVIWCDKNGDILAYSDDLTYYIPIHIYGLGRSVRAIGQKVAQMGGTAIEILDPDKFETSKLREQRRIAKSGALALKDAKSIAEENYNRYQETLEVNATKKFDHADIIAMVEEVNEIYTSTLKEMTNNIEILTQFRFWGNPLQDLSDDYALILETISEVLQGKESLDRMEKQYGAIDAFRSSVGAKIIKLKESINRFKVKYIEQ